MARPPKVDSKALQDTDECIDHGQKGNLNGYGHSQNERLHRRVFLDTYGYLPEVVMHTCDNTRCINPKHLVAGDWDKNNKDRAAKNRSATYALARRKVTQEEADWVRVVHCSVRGNPNSAPNLAKRLNVDTGTIYNILKGRTHFAYPAA
jgi:hypothetical protein